MKKADFHDSKECSKNEQQKLTEKNIISPDLAGRPRISMGKAIFFYKNDSQLKKSIVHQWIRTDPLRLKQGFRSYE